MSAISTDSDHKPRTTLFLSICVGSWFQERQTKGTKKFGLENDKDDAVFMLKLLNSRELQEPDYRDLRTVEDACVNYLSSALERGVGFPLALNELFPKLIFMYPDNLCVRLAYAKYCLESTRYW